MSERPILFSGPMVRAILEGRKTQTRRLLKTQPRDVLVGERATRKLAGKKAWCAKLQDDPPRGTMFACRLGEVGDRLWVRETWRWAVDGDSRACLVFRADGDARYVTAAEGGEGDFTGLGGKATPAVGLDPRWKPGIHMPRWASRITLEITGVRVQRLQDISEKDAQAEGVGSFFDVYTSIGRDQRITSAADAPYRASFACLWDEINGDRALWSTNPWVWAITFKLPPRPTPEESP